MQITNPGAKFHGPPGPAGRALTRRVGDFHVLVVSQTRRFHKGHRFPLQTVDRPAQRWGGDAARAVSARQRYARMNQADTDREHCVLLTRQPAFGGVENANRARVRHRLVRQPQVTDYSRVIT